MYAADSTMYSAASECNELTDVLSSELRMVSECVDMNKLVLYVSKTKCIVFGSRYMLADDPQLNLSMNRTHVEQVKKKKHTRHHVGRSFIMARTQIILLLRWVRELLLQENVQSM